MSDLRCYWYVIGSPICGKPATHGTLVRDGEYYLCTYHAGRARRDGWRGVKPLKPVKMRVVVMPAPERP